MPSPVFSEIPALCQSLLYNDDNYASIHKYSEEAVKSATCSSYISHLKNWSVENSKHITSVL